MFKKAQRLLLLFVLLLPLTRLVAVGDGDSNAAVALASAKVDFLVFEQLKEKGIQPAPLCSDAVFVRRVYLDLLGTLPSTSEVKDFLADKEPAKRTLLIESLFVRPEFADYRALKWSDLLRVKAEFPINLWPNGAQAYHHWLREAVASNQPLDAFAAALIQSSGSNFRVGPVNFYRAVQRRDERGLAQAAALFFLGQRAELWPSERLESFALLFSQVGYKATGEWKEEIVYFDESKAPAEGLEAGLPDGSRIHVARGTDPRSVFVSWIQGAGSKAFSEAFANRAWYWLLGRGLVQEPDDIRPDNPPSNPQLLAFLGEELVRSAYDLRHLFRVILNSKVYQLSSELEHDSPEAAVLFARQSIRRLDAEVLIDAICQITGNPEQYVSAIPEPFTYSPQKFRSIALPDGSITSPFLELFGRPARDTGLESERNNTTTPMQRLHLLNSSHIRKKIEQSSRLQELSKRRLKPEALVDLLCLTVLARHPRPDELPLFVAQLESKEGTPRKHLEELLWALLNSNDFLHRQ